MEDQMQWLYQQSFFTISFILISIVNNSDIRRYINKRDDSVIFGSLEVLFSNCSLF